MFESILRLLRGAEKSEPSPEALHRMRTPPVDADRVLLSATHHWLRRIPPRLHPKHLCRYHPHLANRLAQCWGDRERVENFIDDVLIDRRGGRQGLSDRVQSELQCIERFHNMPSRSRRQTAPPRSLPRSSRVVSIEMG